MTVDDVVEELLRAELCAHETTRTPPPDLTWRAVTGGRRRRRARRAVVASASAVALTCAVVVGTTLAGRPGDGAAPEGPAGRRTSGAPSTPGTTLPGDWVASLPQGPAPEVAYLVDTTLHLPATTVELPGSDAAIIGDSMAGVILLVERTRDGEFSSSYVAVADDGTVTDLPASTIGAPLEALVSPDGTQFAGGERILSLVDGSSGPVLPSNASSLVAWTTQGIVYADGLDGTFLWRPGSSQPPIEIPRPGFFTPGTDVGIRPTRGCPMVVRIGRNGVAQPLASACGHGALASVSPTGQWAITKHFEVLDVAPGGWRRLGPPLVESANGDFDKHWVNDDVVLMSVPADTTYRIDANGDQVPAGSDQLVRCNMLTDTCERTTDPLYVEAFGSGIDLP